MDRLRDKIKKILNKDVTNLLNKYKILLVSIAIVLVLACIGLIVSYAFYQVTSTTPVILTTAPQIPDLEVKIMAEDRDTNGNGVGSYSVYSYIPKAGYKYVASKSYCTNGGTIVYDTTNFDASIDASSHDVCYLYFDSTASLDITLEVYAENIDSDGNGTGAYTKLETTTLPSIGYELNTTKTTCTYADGRTLTTENTPTVAYDVAAQNFTVTAPEKGAICKAYMDAMDVDIQLKLYAQYKTGSSIYLEVEKVPTNAFYTLGTKSACTGTSTMSMKNQRIVIAATNRTSCVAYLDIGSGPILESMQASVSGQDVTITLTNSNLGVTPTTYYYSSDNGATYTSSTSASYTFTNLTPLTDFTFKSYASDASGNTSSILTTLATTDQVYVLNKPFDYSNAVQTFTIEVDGYYKMQVWGAQGGSYSTYYGGAGGYSEGIVYLTTGTNLYIYVGGQPTSTSSYSSSIAGGFNGGGQARVHYYSSVYSYAQAGGGASDFRIGTDSLYSRVIVAGGGGGSSSVNALTTKYGGGTSGGSPVSGYGASQTAAGTNGSFGTGANGYTSGYNYKYAAGGGGGGWYGGGAQSGHTDSDSAYRNQNGGGSGYVYTSSTASNYPSGCLLNSSYYLTSASTVAGNTSFTSPSGGTETGHTGNGYAYLTYVGKTLS